MQPQGSVARTIDVLFTWVGIIAIVIFVIVEVALLYAIVRFRRRPGDEGEPPQIHGSTKLEITWTVIPALILVVVGAATVKTIWELAETPTGPEVLQVNVTGHQWWWEYQYPDSGVVTANELHIPAARKVRLNLQSADVIHSFWIPRLAGKQDVVPGRTNVLMVQADEPLVEQLYGQCVEFCGSSHANMRLRVVVQSQEDFDTWLVEQKKKASTSTGGSASEGRAIFERKACVGCHTIDGTSAQGNVGPNLTHFASRETFAGSMFGRTDENLTAWLKDPPEQKPGSKMPNLNLSDDEVKNLVAYLQSLN